MPARLRQNSKNTGTPKAEEAAGQDLQSELEQGEYVCAGGASAAVSKHDLCYAVHLPAGTQFSAAGRKKIEGIAARHHMAVSWRDSGNLACLYEPTSSFACLVACGVLTFCAWLCYCVVEETQAAWGTAA